MAYWAIYISNMDNDSTQDEDGAFEIYMKKFVYIFLFDLGISPFIKCYQEKSLAQACVTARRFDFLRELLSHKYECFDKQAMKDFKNSCKGKDWKGNNIFHEVFMLEESMRNNFLNVIYDDKYKVKIYLRPQHDTRCFGLCGSSKRIEVDHNQKDREPDKEVQIGDFWKRNRVSMQAYEMEHQQPLIVNSHIVKYSPEIRELLVESFEADYVIVTSEEWPGDQKSVIIENQLKDLGLKRNRHYWIFVEPMAAKFRAEHPAFKIFFAIRFTGPKVDRIAHDLKMKGDLDNGGIRF